MKSPVRFALLTPLSFLLSLGSTPGGPAQGPAALRFEVSLSEALGTAPLDGRLLLLLNRGLGAEPRFSAANWANPQPMWGIDVEAWRPGRTEVFDARALGYPLESIAEIPPGEYGVQAVLNVYSEFRRSDGKILKLHMDQWEGQQWTRSPGNLYSRPLRAKIDPAAGGVVEITLTEKIPPIQPPRDTRYVKHVKIRSELVSRFWGRDMYIGAVVLLPRGFEDHPDARYPVAYMQGHFAPTLRGFGEPADSGGPGGSAFYRAWTADGFPRFLLVIPQEPNPFYLEEAVLLLEKFLRGAANPPFGGLVEYGKRAPHCWSGVPQGVNPTIHYLPVMADHITRTAPAGADTRSWRY